MSFYVSKYRSQSNAKLRLRWASSIPNASLLAFCWCAGCGNVTPAVIEVGSLHGTQLVARIHFVENFQRNHYVVNISQNVASMASYNPFFIIFIWTVTTHHSNNPHISSIKHQVVLYRDYANSKEKQIYQWQFTRSHYQNPSCLVFSTDAQGVLWKLSFI